MTDFIYDIEVLPNVFTCTALSTKGKFYEFEISPRKNDIQPFVKWFNLMRIKSSNMIGFNNHHYDYPVVHYIINNLRDMTGAKALTRAIYAKSCAIINDSNSGNRFAHTIWESQQLVNQIDLFKIHHFDNPARSTSLKRLQFNMRLSSIQEFGVPFNQPIRKSSIIKDLLSYNRHDVTSTKSFMEFSADNIAFRKDMTETYSKSFFNHNDTKIGEDYLIMQLIDKVGDEILYTQGERGRKKRSTPRDVVPINSFIFDYVTFKHPKFKVILEKMKGMKMFVINGKFHWNEHDEYVEMIPKIKHKKKVLAQMRKDMRAGSVHKDEVEAYKEYLEDLQDKYGDHHITCDIDDFTFEFGKGGLHGTLRNSIIESTNNKLILDIDVTSFYPNIGIENNLFPEHLTQAFCPIYAELREMRKLYPKGSMLNALFKLAMNGTYGKTNSAYSVFYDPLYTMATTINGQLMLCMLWEELIKIGGVKLIQANTDGITIEMDRTTECKSKILVICRKWEKLTKLQLEYAIYKRMWIRDGNNYIAEYKDGKLKSKGAYLYSSLYHEKGMNSKGIEWHKNHSMIVVQKAVEAELVHGIPADKFIIEHDGIYDFFLCTNVNRSCQLMVGEGVIDAIKKKGKLVTPAELDPINEEVQRVSRYLISNDGGKLTKVMPPLKGTKHKRFIGINVGYRASIYNDVRTEDVNDYDVNYQFYIDQAEKLLKPFRSES